LNFLDQVGIVSPIPFMCDVLKTHFVFNVKTFDERGNLLRKVLEQSVIR